MRATSTPVRSTTPRLRALATIASAMTPMPPTGRPVEPRSGMRRGS
jgi:hypothetical protein